MMSPLAILLFGGLAAAGIVAGLPVAAAAALGALGWAGRVALAVPRGEKSERIDPFALSEPWRLHVQGAQSAKLRFDRTVAATRAGPMRERLAGLGDRLQHGVADCWRIACRGDDIDAALAHLDPETAKRELAEARRQIAARGSTPALASTVASLEAQLASAERLRAVSVDAQDRLRLLDARMDELVARAAEVSIGVGDTGGLSDEVDGLVTELEALRLALEETGGTATG